VSLNNTILAGGHGWRERSQGARWRGVMCYLRGITDASLLEVALEAVDGALRFLHRSRLW